MTSSITWYLLANAPSDNAYDPNIFTILEVSYSVLQLSVWLERYIRKYQPTLSKQKKI